jgi:hypothetical protein
MKLKHLAANSTSLWRHAILACQIALIALAFCLASHPARAADAELAEENAACLKCHDKVGLTKQLEDGTKLSLHISTKDYLASMHDEINCEDCHSELDAKTHGKSKTTIKSAREFSMDQREVCRDCHKKKFKQYEDSVHAALIREGNDKAPLCSDCHNPHTLRSTKIDGPIATTPCAKCHQDIFKAYAADVHGLERSAKGASAPLCADCHQAHDVKAASLGDGIKNACLSCHEDTVDKHRDWLPNAGRHFSAVSCPACHAPEAKRRVSLRLFNTPGNHQVAEKTGVPRFVSLTESIDAAAIGLDERALWSLLREFNREDADNKITLRGRLEVQSGVEAHQISEKSQAIKDCNICHQEGASPFQSVTLTVAGADGRPLRHAVRTEVLSSLTAMNSIRGFYAIGSTRIKLLDSLLIVVLLGSISVPLIHMTVKRLFKNLREQLEAERLAAQRAETRSAAGEDSPPPDQPQ